MPQTVLLLSLDRTTARVVKTACESVGAQFARCESIARTEQVFEDHPPDVAVCALCDFDALRDLWPNLCVLVLLGQGESEQTIEAIKRGAIDSLSIPLAQNDLVSALEAALRISRDIHIPMVYESADDQKEIDAIVGQSPAMQEMYKAIGLIAPRDINVLITGESGTGKELVARAILQHSPRRSKPFLAVNCAAIPETLLESELFGHEKGAFTGADRRRIGKFEQCDGGTVLLDEIGDIPLPTQAKLLRVLQDQHFQRVGGTETIRTDVRIIAATHQPLEERIKERSFRQDLYYRLNVASIRVPALREREVDAVLLAHYFAARFGPELGASVQSFAPEVLPVLLNHAWPGNVRELENAIKSALVLARGSILQVEHLPQTVRHGATSAPALHTSERADIDIIQASAEDGLRAIAESLAARNDLAGGLYDEAVRMLDRELLCTVLTNTGGNVAATARHLGISRTTLRKKMNDLGILIAAARQ